MDATQHQHANHDPRLISILEVLGSYFVDVYYNHVYNSAQTRLKAGASLTDEYVRHVQSYIIGVKNDESCYREVVQNLHKYFRQTTRYTTLSFADFVERIVRQFIPAEYYDLLKAPEKDESLGSILADLASALGAHVTSPDMLRRIIDGHDDQPRVTIRMVQDQAVIILLAKRGEIHNSFLRRIGQAKETVSMDVVDDMKRAIRKLVKEKAELQARLSEAEDQAMGLEDTVGALQKKERKYKKLVQMLKNERELGLREAAYGAAVPPRDDRAEVDPLEFGPGRAPPGAERIAEEPDSPPALSASFFATTPFTGRPPSGHYAAAPPVAAPPPRRGAAGLSEMMLTALPALEEESYSDSGGSAASADGGSAAEADGGGEAGGP